MNYTTHDVLIISLQFFYAFGGLVLIGSLIFNIIKNQALVNEKKLQFEQDFDVQLNSQMATYSSQDTADRRQVEKLEDTALPGKAHFKKKQVTSKRKNTDAEMVTDTTFRTGPAVSGKKGTAHGDRQHRYKKAARLAARGFSARDIGNEVGLPLCEAALIASLSNSYTRGRWEDHQSMLDAIEHQ